MALDKQFETPSGALASYWKISEYRFNPDGESLTLELYVSADSRNAGKKFILTKVFNFAYKLGERPDDCPVDYLESPFSFDAMNKEGSNFLSVGYDWLKTLDFLSGAKDI